MAIPSTTPFPQTGDPVIDAGTHGYYWQTGATHTIRWAVAGGVAGEFWNNPAVVANEMSLIFASYSYYTNLNFVYSGSFANPQQAAPYSDITISLSGSSTFFPSPSIWARALFPDSAYNSVYQGAPGDVFLNVRSQANYLPSYAPGSAGYFVFMHEIGHALGLKHPHDDGGTGRPTLAQLGESSLDKDWFSIMSYQDDYNYNLVSWDPATPMAMDVLALQYLYGKNMSTNAGDSTYTLPISNTYVTIWDASGNDTVDLTASTQGWVVVLPDFQPSALVDTKVGLALLEREVDAPSPTTFYWLAGDIENVKGSQYIDALSGTTGNNFMKGGGGDDYLDGKGGKDVAFYDSNRSDYTITRSADGTITVKALKTNEGTDSLYNIEVLKFVNSYVSFDTQGTAGEAYRLYQAAFNRKPDIGGLGYQLNALDKGLSLTQVAQNFINSPEFTKTYGSLNDTQFVTQLYANVLHRAPDSGGLAYHTNNLASGISRAQTLVGFSESPENQAALIGVIQNGMEYVI